MFPVCDVDVVKNYMRPKWCQKRKLKLRNKLTMKIATLKFIGKQEGFGSVKSFDLYNIVSLTEPSHLLAVNSTVTVDSVRRAGFTPRFDPPLDKAWVDPRKKVKPSTPYFSPDFL